MAPKSEISNFCRYGVLDLDHRNDRIIQEVLKKTPKDSIRPAPDNRGKAPAVNKGPHTLIKEHVELFHPTISHYRREHAPNVRYLPCDITITCMHTDFKEKYPNLAKNVSYELYRRILRSMNISFTKLGSEECEVCEGFNLHPHTQEDIHDDCNICSYWQVHVDRARKARSLYAKYKDSANIKDGEIRYTADMEKVIMLPRVDTFKKVIFLKRLTVFNETFAPLGKISEQSCKPYAIIWHEGIAGRNKEDIVSAYFTFLKEHRDCTKIIIWVDNCSSQNKNWCLYTFLIQIVNSNEIAAMEISLWYFEPGHTFMAADSVHHQIELSLKHQGKTYDFSDFRDACASANKGKINVIELKVEDFRKWRDLSSKEKLKNKVGRIKLAEICHVKAVRGNYVLKCKRTYDEESPYETLDFLQKKMMKAPTFPPPLEKPKGFSKDKRDCILTCLNDILPENRKLFWQNLPTSD